jgi:putative transposase
MLIIDTRAVEGKCFSEEQINGILKEQEAGFSVKEIIRRHGIAEQTFYRWKSKFGGMEVSDAKRLKELESENARLNRLQKLEVKRAGLIEKLANCGKPPPDFDENHRTAETSLPFKVLAGIQMGKMEMVPGDGIEPPTRGFSVLCSTD